MLPSWPAEESSRRFRFAEAVLDRAANLREDPAALAALRADPRARLIALLGDRPLVSRSEDRSSALFRFEEVALLAPKGEPPVFLGLADGEPRFAISSGLTDDDLARRSELQARDLRGLAISGELAAAEYAAIATARALLGWHESHRFCSRCGSVSLSASSGWKRVCPTCSAEHFPRTDPVVIMLVEHEGRCLLGRGARFPEGMISCLAGFVEPGETIEAAVRRETREEAGIAVGRVAYFASEPWPFPMSMMIGVRAEALGAAIVPDPAELEFCRWFDRVEVGRLLDGSHPDGFFAPPPIAIAHHLMRAFAETPF